jgi:drug/metabolite transporter (DMT)-like permease
VIWGIPYLLIRVAVGEISPATLVFLRTGVGALILLPFVVARGGWAAIGNRWPALLVFAGVEVAAPWFFLSSAEQHISSALAGLLISAVPLVGVVIATALGNREHLGLASLSGLLLGLAGVALIVGFDLHASDATALVEVAFVVIGYAVGPAILSRYLSDVPSVTVIGIALGLCALAYAPAAALQWPHVVPSPSVVASVVVLAVLCTAVAFLLFFALIAEIGPVRATVITYVNPAVAAVLGSGFCTRGSRPGWGSVLCSSWPVRRSPQGVDRAPRKRPRGPQGTPWKCPEGSHRPGTGSPYDGLACRLCGRVVSRRRVLENRA